MNTILDKKQMTANFTTSPRPFKPLGDWNNYMKDGVLLRQCINVIDDLELSDYDEIHACGKIYESILRELQSAGSAGEYYTPRAVTDFMARMIDHREGITVDGFEKAKKYTADEFENEQADPSRYWADGQLYPHF